MLDLNSKLLHADITHEIIGAFYDVYNEMGHGYLESVYANALPVALRARNVEWQREVPFPVHFRGEIVGDYRSDLVVDNKVIVEVKVAERIVAAHEAQLLNYLRASGLSVGLILNFGPKASTRRLLWTRTENKEKQEKATDYHG